jgi:mannose/fructose/N-acetylgalactosamine-specific phosphotransferase system component IIC
MNVPVLATMALGGLAALDATPVAQTLLSQPLVTGTLLGWIWGDLGTGIQVGMVLQLLAASTLPVGARTPEDYASGGVVGAGVALALSRRLPFAMAHDACCLIGVFAGLITATVGVAFLKWQRRRNEGLARWCESALRSGHDGALGQAHLAAITLAFALGTAWAAAAFAAFVWGLGPLAEHESLKLAHAWSLAQPLWLGLGLAALLNGFLQRRLARAAVFGAAMLTTWLVLMLGGR